MKRKVGGVLDDDPALDTLLYPAQLFERPSDVVTDPDLSLNEKRAILASWASDACAVEAAPALRKNPNGGLVTFDEIMDALRLLDKQASTARAAIGHRHVRFQRRRTFGGSDTGQDRQGSPLH